MSLGRLRRGELVLLVALVLLVVALSVRWYDVVVPLTGGDETRAGGRSGWATLGHPWIEFVVLLLVGWVAVLVTAARAGAGRPTYAAVLTGVWAVLGTFLVLLLTLLRSLVFAPDAPDVLVSGAGPFVLRGFGAPGAEFDVVPAAGAWLGLVALLLGLVGTWMAMADDRTTAPGNQAIDRPPVSAVPPLRPAPAAETATPGRDPDGSTPPEPA